MLIPGVTNTVLRCLTVCNCLVFVLLTYLKLLDLLICRLLLFQKLFGDLIFRL